MRSLPVKVTSAKAQWFEYTDSAKGLWVHRRLMITERMDDRLRVGWLLTSGRTKIAGSDGAYFLNHPTVGEKCVDFIFA